MHEPWFVSVKVLNHSIRNVSLRYRFEGTLTPKGLVCDFASNARQHIQLAKPNRIGKGGKPIAFYSPLIPRGTYGDHEIATGQLLS